jgi:hypothetical protein
MEEELIREFYKKVKLIKQTKYKQIWLVRNSLDGELCIAKIQTVALDNKINKRSVLH